MMVNKHKYAIALFENGFKRCTDPYIKVWTSVRFPELLIYLDYALMCEKKCEKYNHRKNIIIKNKMSDSGNLNNKKDIEP